MKVNVINDKLVKVNSNQKGYNICNCDCHIKGKSIIHSMDCCDLTYEKYLNQDKSLNKEELKEIIKKLNLMTM